VCTLPNNDTCLSHRGNASSNVDCSSCTGSEVQRAGVARNVSDRPLSTSRLCYNGHLSAMSSLLFGVPQGSSCGRLLFLLYLTEVFDVFAHCVPVGHSYAADTQNCISVQAIDASVALQRHAVCIERIEQWMGMNRLKINQDKTHNTSAVGQSWRFKLTLPLVAL